MELHEVKQVDRIRITKKKQKKNNGRKKVIKYIRKYEKMRWLSARFTQVREEKVFP